jgi:heat shock protein HslJ
MESTGHPDHRRIEFFHRDARRVTASSRSQVLRLAAPVAAGVVLLLAGCSALDLPEPTPAPDERETVVGAWGSPASEGVGIEFHDDGTFEAHDICSFAGEWMEVAGRIELAVSGGTGMACAEVPNLDRVQRAELSSGTLTLVDGGGRELVELDRLDG